MSYQTKHLVTLYRIAPETLRQWTIEFAEYLSGSANPGANKQRFYTAEDLTVLTLVSEQKNIGLSYDEIHASLKNGNRADPPQLEPEDLEKIVGTNEDTQLAIQVSHLQHNLALAQEALKQAEVRLSEMRGLQEEKIRLEAELKMSDKYHQAEVQRLIDRIEQMQTQLQDLNRQAGEGYAKGFQEGWSQRGSTD